MAVAIDATVGGASTNSYVTEAEADTILEGRLNADPYTGAVADSQRRALVEAAFTIDRLNWRGVRVNGTQALAWPRQYVPLRDAATSDSGTWYATTVIPDEVKRAQVELAVEFLRLGTTDLAALPATDGVKRKKIDVLETEYFENRVEPRGLDRFPRVVSLLTHFLASSGQLELERR